MARGKDLRIRKHAFEGMSAERPPIRVEDVARTLEEAERDDGRNAWKWIGSRTVIVHYREEEHEVVVRGVSATRRRLPPLP